MIPDLSMGLQLYENGEVDNIDLTESNLTTITSDPNNEHNKFLCEKRPTKYSFQMHLNFQRKDENGNLDENWNKAVANRAFRQCFYKGIDFTNYYARTNKINPLKCENDYYTMPGVCYNTKGEEYTTCLLYTSCRCRGRHLCYPPGPACGCCPRGRALPRRGWSCRSLHCLLYTSRCV